MWFVFPQLAGLGFSPTARRYAIASADEARAYLADPVLAPRLRDCARALLALDPGSCAVAVLGPVDALKLRSSMTLFAAVAAPDDEVFADILHRFYAGERDARTLELLRSDR